MADITAGNITLKERVSFGNKYLFVCKVKGDGSGVTIPIPLSSITTAWIGNIDETAGYSPAMSWSGHVLTYATAPTINKYHMLHVVGAD